MVININKYTYKLALFILVLVLGCANASFEMQQKVKGQITEYVLPWANPGSGSTHELIFNPQGGPYAWVTGQNYDMLGKVNIETGTVETFKMPKGSGPHGVAFDAEGGFWVSLEFAGLVVEIDQDNGEILRTNDVHMSIQGSDTLINPAPHAIEFAEDGKTLWFTGKRTSTVGKINPNGSIQHYPLPSLGGVPIYLVAGNDGLMWGTQLATSKIFKVTPQGLVTEYNIPSYNSRPIAIINSPDRKSIWFSQESSHKVAKIDASGNISEYPVPKSQNNMSLAGLVFDRQGNLWTQSYVSQSDPFNAYPNGNDYIIKLSKEILNAPVNDLTQVKVTFYQTPTDQTVFHRIKQGTDGNIWFTELAQDQIGKVIK